MRTALSCRLLTVLLALMTGFTVNAAWTAPVPKDKLPAFAIPKMSKAPVLDGVIDPAEWAEAVALSGIGGATDAMLIARPTTYYLAWDDDHLYMAIRVWVKPGYKPRVGGRQPGSASVFDDGAEFHFQPLGKNVAPGRTDSSYKFIVNALGFSGDFMRVAVGQQFKNWMPPFRTAQRLTEPGSAPLGGRWLEIEWAATTADFELTGPHRPGDQWKLMLCFNHMYHGWTQARIAAITSYFDPGAYPVGTLAEQTPAVQMTLERLPGLMDGVAALDCRVYNPTAKPATVKAMVDIAVDGGETLLTQEKELTVAPGESATWTLNEPLPVVVKEKKCAFTFRVTQGDRELYRHFTFFKAAYPAEAMAPAKPPVQAFPLSATFNPVGNTVMFQADAYYLINPDAAIAADYRVLAADGREIAAGTVEQAVTHYFRRLIALGDALPADTYRVVSHLRLGDGTALGPVEIGFTKVDEAAVYGDWWKTSLGSVERVIPPFTPLILKGQTVSVWGRDYTLGRSGLPEAIAVQGEPLLEAPARLVATIGGQRHELELRSFLSSDAPWFPEVKPWRVRFAGKGSDRGLDIRVAGSVEQDGLVSVELTFGPKGKPVTLDALDIEFPLAADEAEALLCLGPGGNYSARTTMLVPDRQGKLWDTLDTGRNGSGMTVGSFYPCVWLGNERRGLLWWGDSDRGWVPDDAAPAHSVSREGDQVILRNHLLGRQFQLDAPRTVSFTYMASPFRPLVKGWRAVIHSEDGTFSGPHKKRIDPKTGKEFDGWHLLTPPTADPAEWSPLWAEFKAQADARVRQYQLTNPGEARRWMFVHTSLPLMGYGWKSPDERVTGYFAPDWQGDTWSATEQDYFLYIADRAFREGGLRTIYWDIFFLHQFKDLQSGLCYELPDGRIQPGYNGLNIRRFMMRLYGLMGDHGLTPGSQVSHATNDYLLVACGWMDAILDGEYHAISDDSGMDWVDGYPIDRMRVLSCSHTWGVQISWMHLISIQNEAKKAHALRGFQEYPRLYDTWTGPWPTSLPQAVLDFGINDPRTVYHPFWRNPHVTVGDEAILVSAWSLPDRIIMMVFNNDRAKAKDAVLTVDLEGLNLLPELPWQEFVQHRDLVKADGEPASKFDAHGRTLTLTKLLPHTGRVVAIRRY